MLKLNTMEKSEKIITIQLDNLRFKELREKPATGYTSYPLPEFDVVNWTKTSNNYYGPNYMIDESGNVYALLPEEYHAHGDVRDEDRNKIVVMMALTPEAISAYDTLVASNTKDKPLAKGYQAAKPDNTERSEVSTKRK